jgi:enamine deaminase RidA (YjgF/YER057c/UK114 family)
VGHAEQRLQELGLELPDATKGYGDLDTSGARFVSHRRHADVLYLSGTVAWKDGKPHLPGIVGTDLTLEQGYEAARYAMLASLGVLKYALGDLDRVDHVLQLYGFVNSAPDFGDQPKVINGATDLLTDLYGVRGLGARAAIGCQGIALNSSVEVVLTVVFRGDIVREPLETVAFRSQRG